LRFKPPPIREQWSGITLLDRYIFRGVFFTCLAAVGLFAFVLMLGNAIRDLLGPVLSGQLGIGVFAQLLILLVPFVISYALPMGMLTGVLLTLGRLSADNEITAMRSIGVGLARIAWPVILLGLIGAAAALQVNFALMPHARVVYDRELTQAVRSNPLNFIVPRTFIRDFPGYVVYVGDKRGAEFKDFWLWQLDAKRRVTRFARAESGRVDYDPKTNDFIVTLAHAEVETRDEKAPENFSTPPRVASFEQSDPIRLSLNQIFGQQIGRQKLAWMTYAELQAEQARLAGQTVPADGAKDQARAEMKVAVAIQDKFNGAFAVLSFALLGVPLGIKVSRRETSANLGVAVLLALGYYFLTVAIGWIDRHPEYRPDLLLWVPNALLFCLGIWLFNRLPKKR
jgi:lipopolysaccharide export system permease protein